MQEEKLESNSKSFKYSAFTEVKQIILYFLRNWIWLLLGVLISCFVVFLFLRYNVPQYSANIRVLIKDNNRNGGTLDPTTAVFSDLGTFSNLNTNLDNEIEMIASRSNIRNAVKELNLNTTYTIEGKLKNQEIYEEKPFDLLIKTFKTDNTSLNLNYNIIGINDNIYELSNINGDKIGEFTYGQSVETPEATIVVIKTIRYNEYIEKPYQLAVKYLPIENVVDIYLSKIGIKQINKNTNIVEIKIVGAIKKKSEDFLNTLVKVYNQDVVLDKGLVFDNTSKFIEERIKIIADELDNVERTTENFKKQNNLTNLELEAQMYTHSANDFQIKMLEVETQLRVIETMQDFVSKNNEYNILPENIISLNSPTSTLITNYNQVAIDRKRLLQDAGPKNERVIQTTLKLNELHSAIVTSLKQLKTNYELQKQNMQSQNSMYNIKIGQVPTLERHTKNLGRQQNIKEQLYLYLLQKREETAISLAVTAPNAKIIDTARSSNISTIPSPMLLYLAAFILGIVIPGGILYLVKITNNKIKNQRDLELVLPIPFLGEIPRNVAQNSLEIVSSNSLIAEAIRIIRSNLNFVLNEKINGEGQVVFITSTLPKEGKTFISTNLAATIALTGKKIALVGLDIRNPKIHQYIKTENIGVTNYLKSRETSLEGFMHKVDGYDNFYVVPSGPIPPNPAELLLSPKLKVMFENLKNEFDYIIVDNSPMHLVADTQLIADFSDAFIYVVRANYLDKDLLHLPYTLYQEKKLKNLSVVLNDVDPKDSYYGYTYYSYGYYNIEEFVKYPFFEKIKNIFKSK